MATEKARKAIGWFFAVSILAVAVLFIASYLSGNPVLPSGTVLYYGEDCPHCKIVEAFIEENNVTSMMNLTQKEVWYNQTNKAEFRDIVEYCKIDASQAGVPFLYTQVQENKLCVVGDKDIISFLSEQLNISEQG
jgi:hypothetical protein